MKQLLVLAIAVSSFTLMSFKNFDGEKVRLMADGNYYVPEGNSISEGDARTLANLTVSSTSETTVVHTTVWKHKDTALAASETTLVHTTVWKHKDKVSLDRSTPASTQSSVNEVMVKYLQ